MKNNRREFIKRSGLIGMAICSGFVSAACEKIIFNAQSKEFSFLNPIDGDMLTEYDGINYDGSLLIKLIFHASAGREIEINGITSNYENGAYVSDVSLRSYENTFEVKDINSGEKQSIIIYWLKNYTNKYRLSIDDNIWFLKDIFLNSSKYKSLFENQYLSFLKDVHDEFGTKIHLNLFYQTDGFNLSQMPDKYKNEWKENASWLRMSFHGLQYDPENPYLHADFDIVKRDCEMVNDQIRRFAGKELMSPVTTIHWGSANIEGCRALKSSGYKALVGYFNIDGSVPPVSYYLDINKRSNLNKRFIWRDNDEGLIFSKIAVIIDNLKSVTIIPYLEDLRSNSHKPCFLDLLIHEQHFYPFYNFFQPDFRQKVISAVNWATRSGYKPAFLSECIFN